MDISSDGDLIVTGSADKNLRIWGLDFGDCHKSIFAHADSAGKDRLLKYWDADKFEFLLTLEGHHADVWCHAVSNRDDFVVTGSHDQSIRRWDQKEKRLEEIFEADMDNTFEVRHVPKEELPEEGAVALEGKRTLEEQARGKVAELQPNMIMLGLSPSDYVLRAISNISANDMEQT
ncbi:type-1 glutamine synthetase 1-like [Hibiscus syriacus]|uniref:Type-1 glutamine synthetase 1-like n=1 Tax=Hibiscus syriacus TaxID=106335 RepID=A0A6A3C1W0_HIBSY|nr:type-1 glutamine synthetase 1-like [Hibiscus syriacus]